MKHYPARMDFPYELRGSCLAPCGFSAPFTRVDRLPASFVPGDSLKGVTCEKCLEEMK